MLQVCIWELEAEKAARTDEPGTSAVHAAAATATVADAKGWSAAEGRTTEATHQNRREVLGSNNVQQARPGLVTQLKSRGTSAAYTQQKVLGFLPHGILTYPALILGSAGLAACKPRRAKGRVCMVLFLVVYSRKGPPGPCPLTATEVHAP